MFSLNTRQASKKVSYILGVDGGGTKTVARLINPETNEQWQALAGPSSLSNDFSGAISVLEKLIKEVTTPSRCELSDISAVFGLAGAGSAKLVASLQLVFASRFAFLDICTDAETSAYGANNGDEVAVVALGTGSVGMRLQRDERGELTHHLVGGWGFLIDDEGGGAKLGYHSVQALVADFQHFGYAHSKLAKVVSAAIFNGKLLVTRSDIATWLASAKPVDFAQLSPLVFQCQGKCLVAKKLIAQHAGHVENLINDTRASSNLPVVLLGGIAEPTIKFLSESTQALLIPAKGNALDGACLLAK